MQKILDLREFEKKNAQLELGKALAEETKIKNTLEMVARQRAETVSISNETHDINGLYTQNQYLKLLEVRKEELLTQLTQAQIVSEEKRKIMQEKMQKCKVLEDLKEKRRLAWKKEREKEEDNYIDEVVTTRYEVSED